MVQPLHWHPGTPKGLQREPVWRPPLVTRAIWRPAPYAIQRPAPFPIDIELRDGFMFLRPRAQAPLFW